MVGKSREERGRPSKHDSFGYVTVSLAAMAVAVVYGCKKVYEFYKCKNENSNLQQPNELENNTKQDKEKDGLASEL